MRIPGRPDQRRLTGVGWSRNVPSHDRGGGPPQVLRQHACPGGPGSRRGRRNDPLHARPERRGQDDRRARPDHADAPRRGPCHRCRHRRPAPSGQGASPDRGGRPVRRTRRAPHRAGEPSDGGAPVPSGRRCRPAARGGADRALRAQRRRGSDREDLFRRDAATPRPRGGAHGPTADHLPRRADHRARPKGPALDVGPHRRPRAWGHNRAHDDPVPGGGQIGSRTTSSWSITGASWRAARPSS
jgi:hypothetical protein